MMPKTRVEAFTDAVIAIILTLLILELKIPEKADCGKRDDRCWNRR